MRLSLLLHIHCSVPGCDATGAVRAPVEPKSPGAGLGILYAQPDGERLELPRGWSADGLCPEHARPVSLGSERPSPQVLAKAAQLRTLAEHPETPPHEAESAWTALRRMSERYNLEME